MREIILEAEIRNERGKRAQKLRREGKVPGVFYIHGEDNITLAVPERSLHQFIYTSEAHIINLKFNDGRMKSCILRDIQFDPVTDKPLHVDFQGLRAEEQLTLEIPIIVVGGTPQGVRDGGVLQHVLHRLKVSCLPKDMPEHIEVNPEKLGINQSIHVRDLTVANVTILDSPDSTVVAVIPPTVEKVVEPGETPVEEVTEPEVIGKGKKEEEGEEAAESKAEPAPKKETKAETPSKPGTAKKDQPERGSPDRVGRGGSAGEKK